MAKVKDQLAQVGMGTLVAGLQAVKQGISKKRYKRLISTAVAQLLTLHPDYKAGEARRRARKVAGARPVRKMLVKRGKVGLKQGLETVAAAAASGVAVKVASKLGRKVTERMGEAAGVGAGRQDPQSEREA